MTAMATDDPYDLQRFVTAQDAGGTYQQALTEVRAGRKASHWMWFVFPQIAGLGYSPTARTYAITSLAEAQAYLAHPVLGARLTECAEVLAGLRGRTAEQVFGEVEPALATHWAVSDSGRAWTFFLRRGIRFHDGTEVDAMKLCSSMTLFLHADPGNPVFRQVLDQYFGGMTDSATEERI